MLPFPTVSLVPVRDQKCREERAPLLAPRKGRSRALAVPHALIGDKTQSLGWCEFTELPTPHFRPLLGVTVGRLMFDGERWCVCVC